MKKTVSLIMALVLCLFLCSCGGNGNDIPETEASIEATAPEANVMTKDEMLGVAKSFDFTTFVKSVEENKLRAEETYVGKVYKISGFVDDIKDDSCTLRMLDSYGDLSAECITVPLSRDELMPLNTNERITVVGEISEINSDGNVNLSSAYYVTNEFSATVEIRSIVYANVSSSLPEYATCSYDELTLDEYNFPLCNVYLSGEVLATLNEDDEITITGKMVIYDNLEKHLHNGIKIPFKFQDAELVN